MIEDKLTHDERLRLECLAQAVALSAFVRETDIQNTASTFEKYVRSVVEDKSNEKDPEIAPPAYLTTSALLKELHYRLTQINTEDLNSDRKYLVIGLSNGCKKAQQVFPDDLLDYQRIY